MFQPGEEGHPWRADHDRGRDCSAIRCPTRPSRCISGRRCRTARRLPRRGDARLDRHAEATDRRKGRPCGHAARRDRPGAGRGRDHPCAADRSGAPHAGDRSDRPVDHQGQRRDDAQCPSRCGRAARHAAHLVACRPGKAAQCSSGSAPMSPQRMAVPPMWRSSRAIRRPSTTRGRSRWSARSPAMPSRAARVQHGRRGFLLRARKGARGDGLSRRRAGGEDAKGRAPLHNPAMMIDEAVLPKGVALHCAFATASWKEAGHDFPPWCSCEPPR